MVDRRHRPRPVLTGLVVDLSAVASAEVALAVVRVVARVPHVVAAVLLVGLSRRPPLALLGGPPFPRGRPRLPRGGEPLAEPLGRVGVVPSCVPPEDLVSSSSWAESIAAIA